MVKVTTISALVLGLVIAAQGHPLTDTQPGNVQAEGAHSGLADSRQAGAQLMRRQAGQSADEQPQPPQGQMMRRQVGQPGEEQPQPPQGQMMRRQAGQPGEEQPQPPQGQMMRRQVGQP
ncbi:hypothetical protein H4R34_006316, partial [Dimargaris verticillata]